MENRDEQVEKLVKNDMVYFSKQEVKEILYAHGVIEVDEILFDKKGLDLVFLAKALIVEIEKVPTTAHLNSVFSGLFQLNPSLQKYLF